jgi:hypothetical protein
MKLILPTRYAIKFNADFDKWVKLDTSEYEKNYQFLLNDYSSVVIKSKEQNILLQISGINFVINQNWIYFPFFPLYSYCNITLTPNIDIYINPNFDIDENNELNQPIIDNDVIFCGIKIIDETSGINNNYLLGTSKMIGLTAKKYIDIDIEKFYYEYENENNKLLYVDKEKIINDINLIDKYYQYEDIKICKFI